MNRLPFPVIFAFVLLLAGCGVVGAGRGDWDPFRGADERQLRVTVDNMTNFDVNVTVLAAGRRERLGTMDPRSRNTFGVSWSSTQEVRFRLDPLGSRSHTTTPFSAGPGEHVEVVVQQPITRSFVRR